jgi:hypothetical protein
MDAYLLLHLTQPLEIFIIQIAAGTDQVKT